MVRSSQATHRPRLGAPASAHRVAAGIALAVGLAVDAVAGEWTISPTLSLTEEYTDNVNSTTADTANDLITTATAGLAIDGQGARVQLSFDYGITEERHLNETDLDGRRQSLLTVGNVEVIKDYIFIDARASVSQETVSSGGSTTATGRNTADNQTQIVNYSIAPSFVHGNDGWADSELTYRLSETRTFSPAVGDNATALQRSTTHEIISGLVSGRRFSVLQWRGEARTTFQYTGGEFRSRRDVTSVSGEYLWSSWLSPLATVGIEDVQDKGIEDDDEVSGIYWSAGVRLQPGPRTQARIEYRDRFNTRSIDSDFSYDFSPRTRLSGSYSVDIQTQQQALNEALNNLVFDEDLGQLVDPVTQQPVNPNDLDSDLVDATFLTQRLNVGLNGTRGRSTFSMSLSHTRREVGAADGDEGEDTTTTLSGNYGRQLRPRMSLSVDASASQNTPAAGSEQLTLRAGANLSYTFSPTLDGTISYSYLRRSSDDADTLQENTVTVRLGKTF